MGEDQVMAVVGPRSRTRSTADIVATAICSVLAGLVGMACFVGTGFFVMAADGCPQACDEAKINAAFAVSWGGLAVSVVVAVAGVAIAAWRRRTMWCWPVLAIPVMLGCFAWGLSLANAGMLG